MKWLNVLGIWLMAIPEFVAILYVVAYIQAEQPECRKRKVLRNHLNEDERGENPIIKCRQTKEKG